MLHLLQPNSGRHANEMQMQNLYSSCDKGSNNIVIGMSQFAARPQHVRPMTGFGLSVPILQHLQVLPPPAPPPFYGHHTGQPALAGTPS